MKKQLFSIMLLGVFMLPLLSISSHATSAKTKDKIGTDKKHRHHKKAIDITYFIFYTGGGGPYEVVGFGSSTSGTISQYYQACACMGFDGAGTASGTYSYNATTEVMTINAYATPSECTEVHYSGTVPFGDYSSSVIPIGCQN